MKSRQNSLYDALPQQNNDVPKPMSPWVFYPIMLIASLVIFVSISLYVCSSRLQRAPISLHLIKDYHRANVHSWFTYTYQGFSLKVPEKHDEKGDNLTKMFDKKIVCYYNIPSLQPGSDDLKPTDIHADLCTHINIAFANIKNKTINLGINAVQTIKEVVGLKENNKNLKVLLSIGGSGQEHGFSEMVVDHASRKKFIRSIKSILRIHQLDGVDLDWEFPSISQIEHVSTRERQHFSQLLHEIRSEFIREKRNYLLSIAAAAPQVIVDAAYDVDQINMYVDYVNVMTYDYHFYTTYTPFTGLNSPLYARPQQNYYLATLNINYTTHMYLDKGLAREKIVIGVPTYGHSFHLANDNNGGIDSPALGYGNAGSLGFANYPQICSYLDYNATGTTVTYDKHAKVPYLHRGSEWISFDDRESVKEKADFIKNNNLGGAMIYSLNADDYLGTCLLTGNYIKFPLSKSVKNALQNNNGNL